MYLLAKCDLLLKYVRCSVLMRQQLAFFIRVVLLVLIVGMAGSVQTFVQAQSNHRLLLPFVRTGLNQYFVDCAAGNDANSGTSPEQAWRSLARVHAKDFTLRMGEQLLLKRGCAWTGPLKVSWSGSAALPITVGAYGTGALPIIKDSSVNGNPNNVDITGSYLIIEQIHTVARVERRDAQCGNQAVGHTVGFNVAGTAQHVTIRNSQAEQHTHAVRLRTGSRFTRLLHNEFLNNTMMETLDVTKSNDSGAAAIVVQGDDNEIAYNRIDGHDACSYDYGRDGSAVEIYGGQRNHVHHNTAHNNNTFTELGQSRSSDNTFAYNLVTADIPDAQFVVTRGAASSRGPVTNTNVVHNTVYLTHSTSQAVNCDGTCVSNILALKNNIIWSNGRIGYIDNADVNESNNVFWHSNGKDATKVYFPNPQDMDSSSQIADPRFVNAAAGDFRLRSDSPAINMGVAFNTGFAVSHDLAGNAVPQQGVYDAGAYEFVP